MPVRAALFSYFELDDLTRLMNAIAGSAMPPGIRVHIGTYGVNREASITVHTYRQGRYSPMFKAEVRTLAWERRRLTPAEERQVSRRFSGRIPDEPACSALDRAAHRLGIELGRQLPRHDPPRTPRRQSSSIRGSSTSSARSSPEPRAASTGSSSAASSRG